MKLNEIDLLCIIVRCSNSVPTTSIPVVFLVKDIFVFFCLKIKYFIQYEDVRTSYAKFT